MEHDERNRLRRAEELGFNTDELLGLEREEPDFDRFLNRKVEDLCQSQSVQRGEEIPQVSDSRVTPEAAQQAIELAPDAEASLSSAVKSGMDEAAEIDASFSVGDVVERESKLVLKTHEIIGTYVTEVVQPATIDEEWKKVFIDTQKLAVTEMTPEQIIERRNSLDRTIFLIRAQQGGLKIALEELLQATTSSRRAELLELDRKYKRQATKRASDPDREKTKRSAPSMSKGKSKQAKMVDGLKSLEMSKEAIEVKLRGANLLDEATQEYINKCFA